LTTCEVVNSDRWSHRADDVTPAHQDVPVMNEADRIIDATARRQHGAFSREQALAAGLTPRMIDHRRASGAWSTLARSVYALSSHPFTWLQQAKAAELSVPGAALSHGAAAFLHGIPGARAGGLDLTMPPGRHGTSRIATVHRCRTLEVPPDRASW
jgi:hypothetical protein